EVTWPDLSRYVVERVRKEVGNLSPGAEQTPHEVKNIVGSPVLMRTTPRLEAELIFQRGMDLYLGQGAPIDRAEAVRNLRSAAEKGHALAHAALAMCHQLGLSVRQDTRLAGQHVSLG